MQEPKGPETWGSKLSRIVNSTVCFSLAYITFTYLFWLVTALSGKLYGFHAFVYYYGVKFMLFNNIWTRLKITVIYTSGPFMLLVLGLLCIYLYDKLKNVKTVLNLFFVWGFVTGTCMFTAQGIIAALGTDEFHYNPFYQNLSVVFAWCRVPNFMIYLLTIPFLILLTFFAVNYVRPFLRFAYSFAKVNKESRKKKYFIETVAVPFVLGCLITTAATYPNNLIIHALYLMVIGFALLISWAALHYIEIQRDDLLKYKSLQSPSVIFIFLLVCAFMFIYIAGRGIYLPV
jgi:hypothetical protein